MSKPIISNVGLKKKKNIKINNTNINNNEKIISEAKNKKN